MLRGCTLQMPFLEAEAHTTSQPALRTSAGLSPSPSPSLPAFLLWVLIKVLPDSSAPQAGPLLPGPLLHKHEGSLPHPTLGNRAQQDETLTLFFNCCPLLFRKPLSHICLFSTAWLPAKMATGEEHITQPLLFLVPHPLPNRQSRMEGDQNRAIQLPGSITVAFLLRRSGPEPHRQEGLSGHCRSSGPLVPVQSGQG